MPLQLSSVAFVSGELEELRKGSRITYLCYFQPTKESWQEFHLVTFSGNCPESLEIGSVFFINGKVIWKPGIEKLTVILHSISVTKEGSFLIIIIA